MNENYKAKKRLTLDKMNLHWYGYVKVNILVPIVGTVPHLYSCRLISYIKLHYETYVTFSYIEM